MRMTPEASLIDFDIRPTIVHSVAHMENDKVCDIIDNGQSPNKKAHSDDIQAALVLLSDISRQLMAVDLSNQKTVVGNIVEPILVMGNKCAAFFLNKHYKYGQLFQKTPLIPLEQSFDTNTTNYYVLDKQPITKHRDKG